MLQNMKQQREIQNLITSYISFVNLLNPVSILPPKPLKHSHPQIFSILNEN